MLFVLFALSVNASAEPKENPMDDFISLQIETLELELELFGTIANEEIISISSIDVYEVEEELSFDYDTSEYLPIDFDAKEGMNLDWSLIELIEVEEDVDFDFDVKAYLPCGFSPYYGMTEVEPQDISFL
jgi:hypothetical protein